MGVPEAESIERRNTEEGMPQPPASSGRGGNDNSTGGGGGVSKGMGDVHFVRSSSQEIESVVYGDAAGTIGDDRNVDRELDKAEEKMSTQQQSDDPCPSPSQREQFSGGGTTMTSSPPLLIPQGDSPSSSFSPNVKRNEQVDSGGQVDSVPNGEIPLSVTVVDVGSTPVHTPSQGMLNMSAATPAAPRADDMKQRECHVIDVPVKDSLKVQELDAYKGFGIPRTTSNFSIGSAGGDLCRICQQHSEEPVIDLGCHCRGELAKAHRSCIEQWFGNKGTNKCEVCQHVATNVPPPSSQPTPHFWVWRVGGNYNGGGQRRGGGVGSLRLSPLPMRPVLLMTLRRHPTIMLLWLLLFAFMAYLFVDVTDSASIGYAAMPIGFLFGVLVVLGLGTAARLILECWHERVISRNIRRMEEEPSPEDLSVADQTIVNVHNSPVQTTANSAIGQQPPGTEGAEGASQVATRASNMGALT